MLVFGGGERRDGGAAVVDRIAAALAEAGRSAGAGRHGALVEALIEAGCLAQGLADRAFAARGEVDDADPATDAVLALARAVARAVLRSWEGGFAPPADREGDAVSAALAAVSALALPVDALQLRDPEGFAHYAVFPESFALAARALPPGPVCLVGLRSIGATLAAAAAAGRPDVSDLVTVRPVGHPFRREVRLSAALADRLRASGASRFVVVDEGPGLSGSSVAAAVRSLRGLGIAPDRIAVLSSHSGPPGPEADDAIRAVWRNTMRVAADDLAGGASDPAARLPAWFADLVGPLRDAPLDLTGGGWRDARSLPPDEWPPVHPWAERRKVLMRTETGDWLARFVGLGRIGREKLALARRLAEGGFVPEPVALRNGFLLERWHGTARPLDPARDRPRLLARLAAYLGCRARLGAGERRGASLPELFTMLSVNAAEAFGPDVAGAVEAWRPRLDALSAASRPVLVDGRLHAWEWLDEGGTILKADALDHHAGHDLVGPQDIAWDVAGAAVEFDFGPEEVETLANAVDGGVDRELVRFGEAAYAAFQLGAYTMAAGREGPDGARVAAAVSRYRRALAIRLGAASAADRPGPAG